MSRQRTRRSRIPGEGIYFPARSSTPHADTLAAKARAKHVWMQHAEVHRQYVPSHGYRHAEWGCRPCHDEGLISLLGRRRREPRDMTGLPSGDELYRAALAAAWQKMR